jgi:uncharacterized membrane protein
LKDQTDAHSRFDIARTLIRTNLLPSLDAIAQTDVFDFSSAPSRRDIGSSTTANGDRTNLLASVKSVIDGYQGSSLAAVVVVTDGADNQPSAPDLKSLQARGVPVHTIGVGALDLAGEAQLSDVQLPADAPPHTQVVARLVIEHTSAGPAVLRVREGGRLLAMKEIDLTPAAATVRTDIAFDSGSGGIRELHFELSPPPGDLLDQNNKVERLLSVAERKRNVLYLEGEPRWEYKFIQRALQSDDVVDLSLWLRTTERKTYRQGVHADIELKDGFPSDVPALYTFDLIIIGNLAATSFTDSQHMLLTQFVADRGGSVLMLAGREALDDGGWDTTPLARALPVTLDRSRSPTYRVDEGFAQPTSGGAGSPVTQLDAGEGHSGWGSLPALVDVQLLSKLKPAATVLLEHAGSNGVRPLLVTQPYGLGTTAILATSTTWRWQMGTPVEDPRHGRFWRQLVRQLAAQAPQQRSLQLRSEEGDIVLRAYARDERFQPVSDLNATAVLTRPDRTTSRINLSPGSLPGQLGARISPTEPGIYRLDVNLADDAPLETITRFIRTGVDNREFFDPAQNQALLQRIANVTGGAYWSEDQTSQIADAITFNSSGVRATTHLPLWHAPVFYVLLIGLKLSEWALRRWWGRI